MKDTRLNSAKAQEHSAESTAQSNRVAAVIPNLNLCSMIPCVERKHSAGNRGHSGSSRAVIKSGHLHPTGRIKFYGLTFRPRERCSHSLPRTFVTNAATDKPDDPRNPDSNVFYTGAVLSNFMY